MSHLKWTILHYEKVFFVCCCWCFVSLLTALVLGVIASFPYLRMCWNSLEARMDRELKHNKANTLNAVTHHTHTHTEGALVKRCFFLCIWSIRIEKNHPTYWATPFYSKKLQRCKSVLTLGFRSLIQYLHLPNVEWNLFYHIKIYFRSL